MTRPITRVLIANRGEIACRIAATCRVMGIETVTVFAEDDHALPHASIGEMACVLEGDGLAATYLNSAALIAAAQKTRADAIHPGYGFLSENAAFADAVTKAGLTFIGPSAEVIAKMGDKAASRILCKEIGVPTVPGYDGESRDIKLLAKEAERIGYPILVKAAAGGGGKGMRVVEHAKELEAALSAARAEAKNAFGDDRVLLEKYLLTPRHVEVQVFSDMHGNHLHLYERDCSVQRRHQKIIEESPAPHLPAATRQAMAAEAIKITKHIGYTGAGTIEFIMDASGAFYFLEMNTRLQVEHPVTEMVTGLDLVQLQLDVAMGKKLPFTQEDIAQRGHAIEVRLYAEDPARDFMPSPGTLQQFELPQLPRIRAENGYRAGNVVSSRYDPMIAKLVAYGATRDEAIARLSDALHRTRISGVTHNRYYLLRVLNHPAFIAGNVSTDFVKTHSASLVEPEVPTEIAAAFAAAYLLLQGATLGASNPADATQEYSAWTDRNVAGMR
ncbi:MAG: acetyl-CoA carboxylase biotin carboxylase subunit [Rickettsiales bacterium]